MTDLKQSADQRIRLAILAMHPVQYHSPLYRAICDSPLFDAKVLYLDTLGLKGAYDKDFRTKVEWDLPLLEGYPHEFLRNYSLNNTSGFLSRINPGLWGVLRRDHYDAILIQGYSIVSFWIALFAARRLGIKVIWRGEVTLKQADSAHRLRSRVRTALIRAYLNRCDAVMYTCDGNKRFLIQHWLCNESLFPFLCSVDNGHFRAYYKTLAPQAANIKRELGIPIGDLVILFCGRLTQRKRPLDVMEAIRRAGPRDISFVIVGDGPQREELLHFAKMHDIRTVHVGFINQSEISRYYSIADIFCLLSEYDPSPKALNEAMNFSLVPIVSDVIGTAPDLVLHDKTGYRVELGDVDETAKYLRLLRVDADLRQRLSDAASEHVRQFSFDANAAGLEAACRAVLDDRFVNGLESPRSVPGATEHQ